MMRLFLLLLPLLITSQDDACSSSGTCSPLTLFFPHPPPLSTQIPSSSLPFDPSSVYVITSQSHAASSPLESLVETLAPQYCLPVASLDGAAPTAYDATCLSTLAQSLSTMVSTKAALSPSQLKHLEENSASYSSAFPSLYALLQSGATAIIQTPLPAPDHLSVSFSFDANPDHSILASVPGSVYYYASASYTAASYVWCAYIVPAKSFKETCWSTFNEHFKSHHEKLSNHPVALARASHHHKINSNRARLSPATPNHESPLCFPPYSLGCSMYTYSTDKGWLHGYHRTYNTHLAPYKYVDGIKFVEIGVFKGESIGVWEDYFEGVGNRYYGIGYGEDYFQKDVHGGSSLNNLKYSDTTTLYYGDQSNVTFLEQLVKETGSGYTIVVDDGSHDPKHVLITFNELFPHVVPGGLYVIEDIETSYWNKPGAGLYGNVFVQPLGVGSCGSVVEAFKDVVDRGRDVNGLFVGPLSGEELRRREEEVRREKECGERLKHSAEIASVTFGQNVIVIKKSDAAEQWFYEHVRQGQYMHHQETW
jgi:hypothetical protein